jgi:hypothetical protein
VEEFTTMHTGRPEEDKFVKKVQELTRRLNFPIRNADELAHQLGGPDATVEWEGKGHKVAQAIKIMPEYYFPVESEEDLIVKAANLELLRHGNKLDPGHKGEERKPTPDRKPPREKVGDLPKRGREGGPAIVIGERS